MAHDTGPPSGLLSATVGLVSQLLSIVPLETLAGWPAAPNPSVLESLALLVGAPALATLVIIALVNIRAKLTGGYGSQVDESGWAGARPSEVAAAGVPPTSMDTSNAEEPPDEPADEPEKTGGASARW